MDRSFSLGCIFRDPEDFSKDRRGMKFSETHYYHGKTTANKHYSLYIEFINVTPVYLELQKWKIISVSRIGHNQFLMNAQYNILLDIYW